MIYSCRSLFFCVLLITNNVLAAQCGNTSTDQLEQDFPVTCTNTSPAFEIKFGKATTGSVTFDSAFDSGITPIVFLMPTIDTNDTDNDGPASVFPVNITHTGFTWVQEEPISRDGRYVASRTMSEVHWIAVTPTPGNTPHILSDGTRLVANTINTNKAVISDTNNTNYYDPVALDSSFNVLLHQKQSDTFASNNCWLTSISEFNSDGIGVAVEASEVRIDNSCQNQNDDSPLDNAEAIGYLAIEPATSNGIGAFVQNGQQIYYQFGKDIKTTHLENSTLAQQCEFDSSLRDFIHPPTLVASKTSRNGPDGGWLRRCQLTANKVSVVNDEDTYNDSERIHIAENYSFVALENKGPATELTCFRDDFSQGSLTSDWVVDKTNGNFTPKVNQNGRLRLTQIVSSQGTIATYQRWIPGANNIIKVEFDHFAYGGDGGDGMAVIFSNGNTAPATGAFGGALGYGFGGNLPGFAGGWLGIGIDEYGQFSAQGGEENIGRRQQSVVIRGSGADQSGYNYLKGTCNDGTTNTNQACLNPAVDNNDNGGVHRYRITIDSRVSGQSIVQVERRTDLNTGFVSVIAPFDVLSDQDQAFLPTDFILSLTGSTGGINNNHEIDNFELCALSSRPLVTVDHFEFIHDGNGLTCDPESITIKACADPQCTELVEDEVTVNLSPSPPQGQGGWSGNGVVGDQLTFSGGTAHVKYSNTQPSSITLGATYSMAEPTLCRINDSAASSSHCELTYAESGFVFGDLSVTPVLGIPDEYANKPQGNIIINAVQKDLVTNRCIAKFADQTKTIGFWQDYIQPTSGTKPITVNGVDVGSNSTNKAMLDLTFDGQGKASVNINYADAGEVTLHANYTGSAETLDDGLVINGADSFVRYPQALCVLPENAGVCAAGDATCPAFKHAGENFNIDIQPMAWQSDGDTNYCDNSTTPNYAHDNIALSVNLIAPSDGVNAQDIADHNHNAQMPGGINRLSRAISEVGVFTITADPPAQYLGINSPILSGTSQPIGRFYPNDFEVSMPFVADSCGVGDNAYTYMDQAVAMSMTIKARNTEGQTTKNYFGDFASGVAIIVGENNNDGKNSQYETRFIPNFHLNWQKSQQGEVSVNHQFAFVRHQGANNLDGPYSQMQIGLEIDEQDNVMVAHANMNAEEADDDCASANNCNAKALGQQNYRYGRITLGNTFGAETTELLMPVTAEYWNGDQWTRNIADNCTGINSNDLPSYGDDVVYEPMLVDSQEVTRARSLSELLQGKIDLKWQSLPASPSRYRGEVTAPLAVEPWLQWFWDGTNLSDPKASAFFGTYRGQDRIIAWREVY